MVNGSRSSLTTAILRRGELLLHRTLDLEPATAPENALSVTSSQAFGASQSDPVQYGSDDLRQTEMDDDALLQHLLQRGDGRSSQERLEAEDQRAFLEVQQAISVAAAYYEDSLAAPPDAVLTAGTLSAAALRELLLDRGMATREVLQPADVLATVTSPIPAGLLAGLRGALRS